MPAASGSQGEHLGTGPKPTDSDRFRLLVDSILDYAIFMLDPSGHIASWNAGAHRLKGYTAQEVIGKHFSTFYQPQEVAAGKCERGLAIAARDGRLEEEGWRVRKDGSLFWANVVITALHDESGELVGFGKVTRDLSERKAAEDRLSKSEERLRLLIAAVKDYAIFVLDPKGYVASWNTGAERLKGYSAADIVGQHFSVFYPDDEQREQRCQGELVTALEQGRFEEEGWRVKKDGSLFWANVVITPIWEANGQHVGFAKVTRDLSERKRHEEERLSLARAEQRRRLAEENEERLRALADSLSAARDRAERATRSKDEFLATVSHELRTPLNAILGWARMLQIGLPEEKEQHAINAVVRNALAQSQIIDDLLDVSRIVAGQLRLDTTLLDFNQVISAAAEVIRPAADAKELRLEMTLAPGAGHITGDAVRLQQVMWNLLSNAVKFTPRGGHVHVRLVRVENNLQAEVSDSGRGISPQFLPRVFDRFSQQDSSNTRSTGGLGLGLAIVRHLIELHGGTVAAFSEGEGKGATFVVTLPLLLQSKTVEQEWTDSAPAKRFDSPLGLINRRVLVLDDEKDARDLSRSVLEAAGALVTSVASVEEAIEEIARQKPDVIVSDIGMPGLDGYDFIRRLRALPREQGGCIPAAALTAFSRSEDRQRALAAGYQNHAAKPIEPQELVLVVANLLYDSP